MRDYDKKIKVINFKKEIKKEEDFLRKGVKFEGTKFEGCGKIGRNSIIKHSEIGYGTYIGENCNLNSVKLCRFCSLGNNIRVVAGDHPTEKYVSIHPAFYSNELKKEGLEYIGYKKRNTGKNIDGYEAIIGNDVWIGDNVLILGGLKIGDGAVIGAGAVVTKNIPDYTVVAGVPAREIKKRFTEKERIFLQEFKWWNKDIEWIKKNVRDFSDIKFFRDKYKN